MLAFPIKDLPELAKGKGNKIINVLSKDFKAGTDFIKHLFLLAEDGLLTLFSGRRHFKLTASNFSNFIGKRAQRGKKLPQGLRNVDSVSVELPAQQNFVLPEDVPSENKADQTPEQTPDQTTETTTDQTTENKIEQTPEQTTEMTPDHLKKSLNEDD
jgi:hypothetical protein